MNSKIAIFDLDDTLIYEGFEKPIECDEAFEVLNFLHDNGFIICIASLNENAEQLCKQTNLYPFIDSYFAYDDESTDNKHSHFMAIFKFYGQKNCYYFFDDVRENVDEACRLGLKAKLVDYVSGVTLNDVSKLLKT